VIVYECCCISNTSYIVKNIMKHVLFKLVVFIHAPAYKTVDMCLNVTCLEYTFCWEFSFFKKCGWCFVI